MVAGVIGRSGASVCRGVALGTGAEGGHRAERPFGRAERVAIVKFSRISPARTSNDGWDAFARKAVRDFPALVSMPTLFNYGVDSRADD